MEELVKKLEELQGKLDKAILADNSEAVAGLSAELKKMQEELTAVKAGMEEVKKSVSSKITSLPGLEADKNKFSLIRAINAIATKNWNGAGFEREVFQNTARTRDGIAKTNTLSTEVDSAGGYVVPVQVLGDFIELLRANLIVKTLGVTYIEGLTGSPVEVPGQAGGATVAWLGEDNTSGLAQTDLSLRQNQMFPHMAGAIVKLSNRLLRMSNPSIETLVRNDVAYAMASAIDTACLSGTGSAAQPLGLDNITGVLSYDMSTIDKKVKIWSALYELEEKLADNNALKGRLGFAFNPRVRKQMQQARQGAGSEDGAGEFVADPITQNQLASYIGYPWVSTTNIPTVSNATKVYFGNWAELIVGVWEGLTIMASQEASTAFTTNQTWIRFVQEVDVMVRHKESFCIGTGLPTNLSS